MFSKRINLSLIFLMLALGVQAQKTKVKGNIQGLTGPVIFHYRTGVVAKEDTVNVKNGQFTWKVKLSEPQKLSIGTPKGKAQKLLTELYADKKGKIRITGRADSLKLLRISGSRLQKEADAYFSSLEMPLKALNNQKEELGKQWFAASENEKKVLLEKIKPLYDQISKQIFDQSEELLRRYVSAHPKSYFSLHLVTSSFGPSKEYLEMKHLYDLLDTALLQRSEVGKGLSKELALWKERKRDLVGETMLDFTLKSNEGKTVRFSEFKGKYVLVDFWASWCGPCRKENPNVLAAYNRYKDKNFTVLGISLDDDEGEWKKAIQKDKLPWTQVSDLKGFENEVAVRYGIYSIPMTFLVDPDGKIITTKLRAEGLHKKLAELLDK